MRSAGAEPRPPTFSSFEAPQVAAGAPVAGVMLVHGRVHVRGHEVQPPVACTVSHPRATRECQADGAV